MPDNGDSFQNITNQPLDGSTEPQEMAALGTESADSGTLHAGQEYQAEVAELIASENTPEQVPANTLPVQEVPSERVSYADAAIQEIEVALIAPNPFQPRKVFEPEAL